MTEHWRPLLYPVELRDSHRGGTRTRNLRISRSNRHLHHRQTWTNLLRRHDLQFLDFFVAIFLRRESHWAVDVLRANDPSNRFHIRLAGNAFVVVVGTLAHLERHHVRLTQECAQHDLFAPVSYTHLRAHETP